MAFVSTTALAMMDQVMLWAQFLIIGLIVYYLGKLFTVEKQEPDGLHSASPGALQHTAGAIGDLAGTLFGSGAKDLLNMSVWGATVKENLNNADGIVNVLSSRFKSLKVEEAKSLRDQVKKLIDKTLKLKQDELIKIADPTAKTVIRNQLKILGQLEIIINPDGKKEDGLTNAFFKDFYDAKSKGTPTPAQIKGFEKRTTTVVSAILALLKQEKDLETAITAAKAAPTP